MSAFVALLLALAPISAQEVRAPGDVDAGADPVLRETLRLVDPLRAGWESEARVEQASRVLARLATALADGVTEDLPLAPEFRCTDLVPVEPGDVREIFRAAGTVVHRSADAFGGEHTGTQGLVIALNRFRERQGLPRSVEIKIVGYVELDGGFRTTARFHAGDDGTGSWRGRSDASATWTLDWRVTEAGLELLRLVAASQEDVRSTGPLLRALELPIAHGDSPASGPDWTTGMNELRRGLDWRLGQLLLGAAAGIAVGDVDGDGLEDLYLCQPGGLPNRLLVRGPGSLGFVDVSGRSGADFLDFSRSALLVDLDGDGDVDLAVTASTDLLVLENDGKGVFTQRLAIPAPDATSLAAADVDLDGDLDLYVCSYVSPYDGGVGGAGGAGGSFPLPYHDANNGAPNLLLENRSKSGELRFVDATRGRGLDRNNRRFSFAASFEDYDQDGDPDLYVANDFGRNNLYRNDGGSFVDVAAEAGVEDLSAGMGVAWDDVDGDGDFDLYVSNMYSSAGNRVAYQRRFRAGGDADDLAAYRRHARGNTLFENVGDGTFRDVSEEAGVTMARWAWGARFVDLNTDGRLDIASPNGFLTAGAKPDL